MPSWPLFLSDSNIIETSLWPYIIQHADNQQYEAGPKPVSDVDSSGVDGRTAGSMKKPLSQLPLPTYQSQVYRSLMYNICSAAPVPTLSSSPPRPSHNKTNARATSNTAHSTELLPPPLLLIFQVGKSQYLRCTDSQVRSAASEAISNIVRDFPLRKWFLVGNNNNELTNDLLGAKVSSSFGNRFGQKLSAAKSQNQKVN